jgi:hypothetical protein
MLQIGFGKALEKTVCIIKDFWSLIVNVNTPEVET